MNTAEQTRFNKLYQQYLNELTLQGKSPKTVDMYSRYILQLSTYFDCCPDQKTKMRAPTNLNDGCAQIPPFE